MARWNEAFVRICMQNQRCVGVQLRFTRQKNGWTMQNQYGGIYAWPVRTRGSTCLFVLWNDVHVLIQAFGLSGGCVLWRQIQFGMISSQCCRQGKTGTCGEVSLYILVGVGIDMFTLDGRDTESRMTLYHPTLRIPTLDLYHHPSTHPHIPTISSFNCERPTNPHRTTPSYVSKFGTLLST
jgi:hypothetical protein